MPRACLEDCTLSAQSLPRQPSRFVPDETHSYYGTSSLTVAYSFREGFRWLPNVMSARLIPNSARDIPYSSAPFPQRLRYRVLGLPLSLCLTREVSLSHSLLRTHPWRSNHLRTVFPVRDMLLLVVTSDRVRTGGQSGKYEDLNIDDRRTLSQLPRTATSFTGTLCTRQIRER